LVLVPNDAAGPSVASLAADLAACGACVIAAGSDVQGAINLPTVPGLHPAVAPAACVLGVYRMVEALSVARGFDPDSPPLLHKVTETR
jgi:glucosamine--fructose-6-phosphate aminotransferase (isomerizing)